MSSAVHQEDAQPADWRSPQYSQAMTLVPIDFTSQQHRDELLRQRRVCGWAMEEKNLDYWQKVCNEGLKEFWFITVPAKAPTATGAEATADASVTEGTTPAKLPDGDRAYAGHIALTSGLHPPTLQLANPDKSVLGLTTFFIYPEHRGGGLGREAVAEVERRAFAYEQCKNIAVDCISRRYNEDGSLEWGGRLEAAGFKRLPGRSNEDWYARMGYVKFAEQRMYPMDDGNPELLMSSFMRKPLR